MSNKPGSRRIRVLRESTARKIAAGEVIDRPLAVVRELLDNSLDAGATSVEAHIEAGGTSRIRVVDDGTGMSREDLELCVLPHATSKIDTEDDLLHITSLGFRGEALAGIAAVSKVEIISAEASPAGSPERPTAASAGNRLVVHGGKVVSLREHPAAAGTVVDVQDLFYAVPARRKFLSSAAAESGQCRAVFVDRALSFPSVSFRFFTNGELRQYLAPADLPDRVADCHSGVLDQSMLLSATEEFDGFSVTSIIAEPGFHRRDRRYIQVFVNKRRIQEYALVQAVSYGFSEHLPGGSFPAAFVFIDIDPRLVDFNIHPAKREVRFRNKADLHRAVVRIIKSQLAPFTINLGVNDQQREAPPLFYETTDAGSSAPPRRGEEVHAPSRIYSGRVPESPTNNATGRSNTVPIGNTNGPQTPETPPSGRISFTYHGQIFGLFLVVELEDRLYLVDQHAAHERILYERYRAARGATVRLLVPIPLELNQESLASVKRRAGEIQSLGIQLQLSEDAASIVALPTAYSGMENEIAEFIRGAAGLTGNLEQRLFAEMACKAAIRDGESVDDVTARELIDATFALRDARCPHGRPVWFELSKDELFQLVGRS